MLHYNPGNSPKPVYILISNLSAARLTKGIGNYLEAFNITSIEIYLLQSYLLNGNFEWICILIYT